MKKLYFLLTVVFLFIFTANISAQLPTYSLVAKNITFAGNSLEFEFYLLHTNAGASDPFQYGGCQYFLNFNTLIANGGSLSLTKVNSDLPIQQQPGLSVNIPLSQLRFSANLINPGFFISSVYPGTKIMRARLTTTAATFAPVFLNLAWRSTGTGLITKISYLNSNNIGIFITNPASHIIDSTSVFSQLINPSFNGELAPGPVEFIWHKTNAVNYTLQVATDFQMNNLVINDSLLTDTTKTFNLSTDDTKYYWRILSRDSNSHLTSSPLSEFYSRVLNSPPNHLLNSGTTLNFLWNKVSRAQNYALKISTDSLQKNIIFFDSTLTDTFRTVGNFLNNSKYFWSIRITDSTGNTSYSSVWSFQVSALHVTLLNPPNNSVDNLATIDFRWTKSFAGNVRHQLKLSTDSIQNSVLFLDSNITDTFKTVTNLFVNQKYYWSVKETDSIGNEALSDIWNFTTVPLIVALDSPPDNATGLVTPVIFKWYKLSARTIRYAIKLSFDSLQHNYFYTDSTITDTMKSIGSILLLNHTYFWTITAIDSNGNRSFSPAWKISIAPLPKVNLVSPADSVLNQPPINNFVWNRFPGTLKYILRISKDFLQSDPVYIDSSVTDTFKTVGGFTSDHSYYWRVTARDSLNILAASDVRKFSTVYNLIDPPDGSYFYINTPVQFRWHKISGASNYLLIVARDTNFSQYVFKDSTLTDTTKILNIFLIPYTTYYWRVFAKNSNGYILTSSLWSFNTYFDIPTPVELTSFTFDIDRNDIKLNWTTASEVNNALFEIERSQTSNEWNKVGSVDGNGTSSSSHNYSFEDRNLTSGKYNYRLKQMDYNGHSEYFNLKNEVNVGVPNEFSISQNYPNPFNPSTKIDYDLPSDGKVNIVLYDLSGREVATLLNENKTAGYYSLNFNGSNLSSGVYFYRINVVSNNAKENFVMTKRMVLVK